MQSPILLVTRDTDAQQLDALQAALSTAVVHVRTLRAALLRLSNERYSIIVVDSSTISADPEILGNGAGIIPIVEIDLASTTTPALARQIRLARSCFARERLRARAEALAQLKGELRDSLSGLLLESELALREADPVRKPKLEKLVQLATRLGDQLKLGSASSSSGL